MSDHKPKLKLKLDKDTGNSIVIFGRSKGGKTTLMMDTIFPQYFNNNSYIATLFAGNPQIDLYKGYKRLIVTNSNCGDYIKAQKLVNIKTDNHYKFVNLVDDNINLRYNNFVNESILTLRNSNLSTILCFQYARHLSKQARPNVNNLIFLNLGNDEATKEAIDIFLASYFRRLGYNTLPLMIEYYNKMTSNFHYFYLHQPSGYLWHSLLGTLLKGF